MIDLEKEREAFEINWLSLGGKLDNFEYTTDQMYSLSKEASKKLSEQDKLISIMIINQSWSYWLNFARANQAEITKLKQKLEKIESGEFVLMPKGQIHKTWQDANEPENIVFKTDDLEMLGDCYDIGDLIEIKQYDSAYFNHSQIYATWTKDKAQLFFGSKEECNDVIKIVSLNKDLSDSSITSERFESISDNQTMGCKNGK